MNGSRCFLLAIGLIFLLVFTCGQDEEQEDIQTYQTIWDVLSTDEAELYIATARERLNEWIARDHPVKGTPYSRHRFNKV